MGDRAEQTYHATKHDVSLARSSPKPRTSDVDMSKRNETHEKKNNKIELWGTSQDFKFCATHSRVCGACHELFPVSSINICRSISEDIDNILRLGPRIRLGL